MDEKKAPKWKPNPGECPRDAKGKRVVVKLNNGDVCGEDPVTTVTAAGWAADGKHGANWTRDPEWPFAIAEYYVLE